nr:hypothetical protein [Aquicoccus sp. G2-2]MEA1113692.1 hypothetical protein [Aquicoccus sp. G2-2]
MTSLFAFAAALSALPVSASAGQVKHRIVMPPDGYQGQFWTDNAGCTYSRTGRPDEIIWFMSGPPVAAGCPEFIVQKERPGGRHYRAPRWNTK